MDVLSGASATSSTGLTTFDHDPGAVLQSSLDSFWITPGLFPQELIITLAACKEIRDVEVLSMSIHKIELAKCDNSQMIKAWEICSEVTCDNADGEMQRLSIPISSKFNASSIRLRVLSGWSDFVCIFKVNVIGTSFSLSSNSSFKRVESKS